MSDTGSTLELLIPDAAAMEQLGKHLAAELTPGKLFLTGDLGAGKTTLVRGFLRAKGYQGPVKSPTYTLIEPYCLGGVDIYHFDLYRIDTPDALEALGARDYFAPTSVCLVEWADRAPAYWSMADLSIHIEQRAAQRKVIVVARSPAGRAAIARAPFVIKTD
ncbi:MAG: tRNA (adenosine(37)-N6)-threonylcarbamoyltransferase complex ATPase subunit type 1 TsaE [Gammaproteobacteria bacterium]